ncbi:COQ9 family protein [Aquicoccus porphyridii]|uniref:COQ9 family protein n=1 Tax=Aquicoccus porphyridii TaxID=1852029 RepID=A0A5A9ZKT3_9RHOB|nr:COQ9 family protein [Aquicoccus porphyridii]KAA0917669.1 COQ9 family protein [Aquicoccus porphyridii]RAI55742.1 COQ9 family protein [Rhodobacteraceae bacterium AsT-22]
MSDMIEKLLDAALIHVPFDGWSDETFNAAVAESGVEMALARAMCPRGAVDLAAAYHRRGDQRMVARLNEAELAQMRFRDRIAAAVRFRIEAVEDKELVRRGMTLFALPQHAPEGTRLIWGTCDLIWRSLGDTSDDVNWYTKRMTLSGVYSSTLLYWLGDESEGFEATWAFLDRRIEDVMQFETLKARLRDNPALSRVLKGPLEVLGRIRAPKPRGDMPGHWDK